MATAREDPTASTRLSLDAGGTEFFAELARECFGRDVVEGVALAHEVRRVSDLYNAGRAPEPGDARALCARLRFFLPRDLPKLDGPLAELARVGAFPRRETLRVLDLGAGVGTSTLGLARFAAARDAAARLDVDAIDRDRAALAIAARVWERSRAWGGVPIVARSLAMDLTRLNRARLRPPYDVVLLGLVLGELAGSVGEEAAAADQFARLAEIVPCVAEDGVLVILEPALRRRSRVLHRVRDALAHSPVPPYVFAPCVRRGDCPMLARERDWCHEEVPLALSPALAALARAAGLRDRDLTYSYLTLHMRARSLREIGPASLLRVVGGPLRSKGKVELLVCGDVPALRLRRLDREAGPANAAFGALARGDVIALGDADESDASVWRVGAGTRVDRSP